MQCALRGMPGRQKLVAQGFVGYLLQVGVPAHHSSGKSPSAPETLAQVASATRGRDRDHINGTNSVLFFFYSFIEIYHSRTVQFIHFKVYNSMILSIVTELYNHHQYQFWNISITPKRNFIPISPQPSQPYATTNRFSVFKDLHTLDTSYEWNHVTCGLL